MMLPEIIDFTDTKEMFVRYNGKLHYFSYLLNDSQEYKWYLINRVL